MSKKNPQASIVKVVYFDEETASDYLDISAGDKTASTSKDVKERTKEMHGKVEACLISKLSWLPFFSTPGEMSAGARASAANKSVLSKTLSNTILTDCLANADGDSRIVRLRDLRVTALKDSMAYMKIFMPYVVLLKFDDVPFELARMDEALADAKGYYELLGKKEDGSKRVLRFNIKAFRNNYGLTDLGRMRLVFHGVLVGHTPEHALSMEAKMSGDMGSTTVTVVEVVDGMDTQSDNRLDVYDVILAGVRHVG